jgi:hypothetical protein
MSALPQKAAKIPYVSVRPICADFVAEVADERGKLRLGELEALAATGFVGSDGFEVTALSPRRGYNAT